MGRALSFYIFFSLFSFANLSAALTINNSEVYYLVVPNNASDVHRAIRNTSKLKGTVGSQEIKAVATHHGTYTYNLRTAVYQHKCYVSELSVTLNSKITLPKIDLHAKKYTDKTLAKFEKYVQNNIIHEKEHRKIYVKHLRRTINKLRAINKNNSTFTSCKDLKNNISQEFHQTSQIIRRANTMFDCQEYGIKRGLKACMNMSPNIASTPPQKTQKPKTSDFSSLTEGGKSDVKSYKDKGKPEEQECDGKLIEPFKGKFYCVPSDNFSE